MSKRLLWKSWFDYCNTANMEDSHGSLRYFMDYASFNHPICCVPSYPNSRQEILGVFQWYRIISPYLTIKVNSVGTYSTVHLFAGNELTSHRQSQMNRTKPSTSTSPRLFIYGSRYSNPSLQPLSQSSNCNRMVPLGIPQWWVLISLYSFHGKR